MILFEHIKNQVSRLISSENQWLQLSLITLVVLPLSSIFLSACSTTYNGMYASGGKGDAGERQVTEIIAVASEEEISPDGSMYNLLISAKIPDEDIRKGSIGVGRMYCCGGEGTIEVTHRTFVYIPPEFTVATGDIVEFTVGREPDKGDGGIVNTLIAIRNEDGINTEECRYVPEDPRLWMRIVYCDWMLDEGWIKRSGSGPAVMYKP